MIKDINGLVETIVTDIRNRVDVAVIGLSGGADSTLVACLCVKALGKENVYGVHMPFGEIDKETFNKRSTVLAEILGVNQITIDIKDASASLSSQLNTEIDKVTNGNTRARLRMSSLYMVAGMLNIQTNKKVRVANTCNASETLSNYDTKWGDNVGDFSPIGDLFKSEVYQLLEYFRDRKIISEEQIDRNPSAGLWLGQSDLGELGYSYDQMEPTMRLLLGLPFKDVVEKEILEFVKRKIKEGKHKIDPIPVTPLRKYCD